MVQGMEEILRHLRNADILKYIRLPSYAQSPPCTVFHIDNYLNTASGPAHRYHYGHSCQNFYLQHALPHAVNSKVESKWGRTQAQKSTECPYSVAVLSLCRDLLSVVGLCIEVFKLVRQQWHEAYGSLIMISPQNLNCSCLPPEGVQTFVAQDIRPHKTAVLKSLKFNVYSDAR